jgi:hypothetical protein
MSSASDSLPKAHKQRRRTSLFVDRLKVKPGGVKKLTNAMAGRYCNLATVTPFRAVLFLFLSLLYIVQFCLCD